MHRWLHLLGAIALILTLWTGGTARAAEGYIPIAVAAENTAHFAGDSDEVPSDQHQGVPHHHAPCGDHQLAAETASGGAALSHSGSRPYLSRDDTNLIERMPGAQLRPPIA